MPVHDRLGPTGGAGGEDEQADAILRVFRFRFGGRVRVDGGKSQRARQQAVDHGRPLARGVLGAGDAVRDGEYGDTRFDQCPQGVQLGSGQPRIHHGGPGAQGLTGEQGHYGGDIVLGHDEHPVTGHDAALAQEVGDFLDSHGQRAVVEGKRGVAQGRCVGSDLRPALNSLAGESQVSDVGRSGCCRRVFMAHGAHVWRGNQGKLLFKYRSDVLICEGFWLAWRSLSWRGYAPGAD
ncbi:hypothetical protein D3C85_781970 [compost metagenome]